MQAEVCTPAFRAPCAQVPVKQLQVCLPKFRSAHQGAGSEEQWLHPGRTHVSLGRICMRHMVAPWSHLQAQKISSDVAGAAAAATLEPPLPMAPGGHLLRTAVFQPALSHVPARCMCPMHVRLPLGAFTCSAMHGRCWAYHYSGALVAPGIYRTENQSLIKLRV